MTLTPLEETLRTFRDEASERLAETEAALLALDAGEGDKPELVDRIFRAVHTVKGASGMVGLEAISSLAHALETVFEHVRAGRLAMDRVVVDVALGSVDLLRALVETPQETFVEQRAELGRSLAALSARVAPPPSASATSRDAARKTAASATPPATTASGPASEPAPETYRVRFRPHADLFKDGSNPALLCAEMRSLGSCQVVADLSALPPFFEMDPEACYVSWDGLVTTTYPRNALRDVFVFVEDKAEVRIEALGLADEEAPPHKKLGEILIERGDLTPGQLEEALASQKRIGQILLEKGFTTHAAVSAAALEQSVRQARGQNQTAPAAGRPPGEGPSSVRVAAERLDQLVDLVGELVIAQARLSQIADRREDAELTTVAEDLARLSTELRDSTLGIRMIPIGTTFGRFNRLVHDLAGELGKDIALVTEGADTELDKTVIDRLSDPLVHLIRNSCDHGIESPAARAAAGKPARGTVRLCAYHAGRHVVVEIQDDGGGLDLEAIRKKALERGLIAPGDELDEHDLAHLIFLPGFSTAAAVSQVSGRGVGMDVVKRSVDALRGTIDIQSRRGEGTTLRITLPLTLAIIEGLLVKVGDGRYVLPMSLVEECVELTRADVARSHGNHVAPVRGELVPYLRLREHFAITGEGPPIEQITIVTAGGFRCGLVVDHVVGQHQTVIKTLGSMYEGVDGISGATILGDGTVALIVDVPNLLRTITQGRFEKTSANARLS